MVKKTAQRTKAYLLLALTTLIWGAAFILVKPSFKITTPMRFLFYRYLIAGILSLPIFYFYYRKFWLKQTKKIRRKFAWRIILLEFIGGLFALSALYYGLNYVSVIETSLLASTTPIFIVIAGIIFLKEKEEKHEIIGLILAVFGTLILTIFTIFRHQLLGQEMSFIGSGLILIHNIMIALYYILAKKHYKKIPKLFIASVSFYLCLISFFLISLAELNWSWLELIKITRIELQNPVVLIPAVYMGFLGSIVAFTASIKGQDYIEASEASLFQYLQPLVAIPLSLVFLNEKISIWQIVALSIILTGVWCAEKRKK